MGALSVFWKTNHKYQAISIEKTIWMPTHKNVSVMLAAQDPFRILPTVRCGSSVFVCGAATTVMSRHGIWHCPCNIDQTQFASTESPGMSPPRTMLSPGDSVSRRARRYWLGYLGSHSSTEFTHTHTRTFRERHRSI